MLSRTRRPGHATVVAYLALFVALSGSAYAAATISGADIRNNSVTGADIRQNSLTGDDVRQNSITGEDVRQSSITASDIRQSTVTGGDIRDGTLAAEDFKAGTLLKGDPGAPGVKGDTGAPGANGATNVTLVTSEAVVVNTLQNSALATCPAGQRATGGGIGSNNANGVNVNQSGPVDSQLNFDLADTGDVPIGWFGRAQSTGQGDTTLYVYAICASP